MPLQLAHGAAGEASLERFRFGQEKVAVLGGLDALDDASDQDRRESSARDLDLGKFRHRRSIAAALHRARSAARNDAPASKSADVSQNRARQNAD